MVLAARVIMTTHMSVKTACILGMRYIATEMLTKGAHRGRGTMSHTRTLNNKFHLNRCLPIFIGRCSRVESGSDLSEFFPGVSGLSDSFPLIPLSTSPSPERNILSFVMCGDVEVLRSQGRLIPLINLSGLSSSSREILHKCSVSWSILHSRHFVWISSG